MYANGTRLSARSRGLWRSILLWSSRPAKPRMRLLAFRRICVKLTKIATHIRRRTHKKRTDVAKFVNKRDRTVHSPRPASYSRCVSLDESDYLTHDGRKREGKESACLTLPGTSRLRAKSLMARCIAMRASLCIPCMRHAFILHI